ncbi:hypothetical protein FHG87_024169, partial [Trinorchestia longiramus]
TSYLGIYKMASGISRDFIKPFTSESDVMTWLEKVTLVARLQKVSDLAMFIPLYLEGDALALYMELSDGEKASADKIKEKLQIAFGDGPFVAYNKLLNMKWVEEPVDVFANELKRLARLA